MYDKKHIQVHKMGTPNAMKCAKHIKLAQQFQRDSTMVRLLTLHANDLDSIP